MQLLTKKHGAEKGACVGGGGEQPPSPFASLLPGLSVTSAMIELRSLASEIVDVCKKVPLTGQKQHRAPAAEQRSRLGEGF